jgi:hypothetical protein
MRESDTSASLTDFTAIGNTARGNLQGIMNEGDKQRLKQRQTPCRQQDIYTLFFFVYVDMISHITAADIEAQALSDGELNK